MKEKGERRKEEGGRDMRIVRAVMWCKRQLRYFELAVAASKSFIKIK